MKIERKTYRDGNLYPEAFNYLKSLPENIDYYQAHIERHPLSIYDLSIQRVMKALAEILDEIERINHALFDAEGRLDYSLAKLPILQKELLEALMAHIDDCYRILKVLHPYDSSNQVKFNDKWLDKAKNPAKKDFENNIKDYKNLLSPIVNKIKHNGGQLRSIVIYSRDRRIVTKPIRKKIQIFPRDARIVGYFLEGVHPNGNIGPDIEIHPNGKSAISLNRDLRYHFANLYRIGRHLKKAIVKTVRHVETIDLPYPGSIRHTSCQYDLESIAEKISNLPSLFYQNEFDKETPDIQFYRNPKDTELILETPGPRYMNWEGEVAISCEMQVDPVSRTYQLPYWQNQSNSRSVMR